MCEVTKSNFQELFPVITEAFKNSTFLSVDCEFSALCLNNDLQNSLFDTPSQRYYKAKQNIKHAIPLQIGVTAFCFDRDENRYIAKPFIFYIMPPSFCFIDKDFVCSASSLSFLCDYNFDFNKFVYNGIPYLNRSQEKQLSQSIDNGTLLSYTQYSLHSKWNDSIQEYSSVISKWFFSKEAENEIVLFELNGKKFDYLYVLHALLRNRFYNMNGALWTYIKDGKFIAKKITVDEYQLLSKETNPEKEVIEYYLGFTRVFRLMSELKKPVVGHNFFLDLMILINSFHNEVPNSYSAFKKLSCDIFPITYDTKYLSFEIRNELSDETKWESNRLEDLYTYFHDEKGRHLVENSPRIEVDSEYSKFANNFHDAGWDSYCTGYCFIRIAHFFTAKKYEVSKRVLMSSEHMASILKFKNNVNIIRATVSHLNLEGKDPVSRRPPYLIIRSSNKKAINISKVAEILSPYGSVEIRPYCDRGRTAIAAVANFSSARRILQNFHSHEEFRVSEFSIIKHSPVCRAFLWTGVALSSSALIWLVSTRVL